MTMKKNRMFINMLIWAVLTISIAGISMYVLDWTKYFVLVKKGIPTQGLVTAKEPNNHNAIRYSYLVGQRTYTGLGRAGHGNPQFEELEVGDKVMVFYDPVNPSVSFIGNPQEQLESITTGIVFISLIIPLLATIAIHRKSQNPGDSFA